MMLTMLADVDTYPDTKRLLAHNQINELNIWLHIRLAENREYIWKCNFAIINPIEM